MNVFIVFYIVEHDTCIIEGVFKYFNHAVKYIEDTFKDSSYEVTDGYGIWKINEYEYLSIEKYEVL